MEYKIRSISEGEYILLNDFLYEAIFVPPGISPPPKSIINKLCIQMYTQQEYSRIELSYMDCILWV